MADLTNENFGSSFERVLAGLMAVLSGAILIFLAVKGPLVQGVIRYKTAQTGITQIQGQDIINLALLGPVLLLGGTLLLFKKSIAKYLLMLTPLYLIYFVLSYTIGLEWSSAVYTGNSEKYSFYFLFILVSGLVLLLYSLSVFPKGKKAEFKRTGLTVYSVLVVLFTFLFAAMWLKEVWEVMTKGTTRGYSEIPTGFWVIRYFDLGFTIPLSLISVYLLWTRPERSYSIQLLFYGFFITMVSAVSAMGWLMYFKKDPLFLMRDMVVFGSLALIVFAGFAYILKNYKEKA
ncbi:MAG: hypothetical protein PHF84_11380 [bacterium]|nr:hypothetical protein [bacterium]